MLNDSSANEPASLIPILVKNCEHALQSGLSLAEIRSSVLPEEIQKLMTEAAPRSFLQWIKEDRVYSSYYYEAQQSGVCAKPGELLAAILESIVLDALE